MSTAINHTIKARAKLALPYLKTMRETFSDPEKWTRGAFARTKHVGGTMTEPRNPTATCWCLEGLAIKLTPVTRIGEVSALDAILQAIADADPDMRDPVSINDMFGLSGVQTALERAIAKCEKDLKA